MTIPYWVNEMDLEHVSLYLEAHKLLEQLKRFRTRDHSQQTSYNNLVILLERNTSYYDEELAHDMFTSDIAETIVNKCKQSMGFRKPPVGYRTSGKYPLNYRMVRYSGD